MAVTTAARQTRRLVVNGESVDTAAATLADLLLDLGYGDRKVATAHNGDFVVAKARAGTRLSVGDKIEIVSPRQGG